METPQFQHKLVRILGINHESFYRGVKSVWRCRGKNGQAGIDCSPGRRSVGGLKYAAILRARVDRAHLLGVSDEDIHRCDCGTAREWSGIHPRSPAIRSLEDSTR